MLHTSSARALFAMAAAALASPAFAQISYVSQARYVQTAGGVGAGPHSHTVTAPDFQPFTESINHDYPNSDGYGPSNGYASQNSTLNPTFISMNGALGGNDAYGSGGSGAGLAYSSLTVTFDLLDPQNYHFFGTNHCSYTQASDFTIRLKRGSTVLNLRDWFGTGQGPFDFSGVLVPGSYELFLYFKDGYGGSGTGSGAGSFDIRLDIPTPLTASLLVPACVLGSRRRR